MISKIAKELPTLKLITDPQEFSHWAQDWTRFYKPKTIGIAFPDSPESLSALVKVCTKANVAITPSGGRTGLSGGAVAYNGELVVSLTQMKRLEPVNTLSSTIRAQAGVITKEIQESARKHHLYFPLDLASSGSCTIGGNLATNAGGLHVVRYGHLRRWVQSLQIVLMNGDIVELNGDLEKNNTGYDLRNLIIGSEGTLALISAATLKLCETPKDIKTLLFGLKDFSQGLKILQSLRQKNFVIHAFESLSQQCFELVKTCQNFTSPFAKPYPYYLLFEVDTLGSSQNISDLENWLENIYQELNIPEAFLAQSSEEQKKFWAWRENITESLNSMGIVYKNDIAVPIYSLPDFITQLEFLAQPWFGPDHLFLFGHIGDGNIHVNLLKPKNMEIDTFRNLCEQHNIKLFELVKKFKGSIAAEHGIGLLKRQFLHYSKSPQEILLMKQIKSTFDPNNLLNPGKIFHE